MRVDITTGGELDVGLAGYSVAIEIGNELFDGYESQREDFRLALQKAFEIVTGETPSVTFSDEHQTYEEWMHEQS